MPSLLEAFREIEIQIKQEQQRSIIERSVKTCTHSAFDSCVSTVVAGGRPAVNGCVTVHLAAFLFEKICAEVNQTAAG